MTRRDWHILLIGGGTGTGKTRLSEELARHFSVRAVEGDVLRWSIESVVSPGSDRDLHIFHDPSFWELPVEEMVERSLRWSARLCEINAAVLVRHHFVNRPIILEAVWVLPEFAAQTRFGDVDLSGRIRSLFLYEPDIDLLRERLYGRDGALGLPSNQPRRLASFHEQGLVLKQRAEALGLPVLECRPFETLFERALAALQ